MKNRWDVIIIGAGAAGLFASIRVKELSPKLTVLVLERAGKPLGKVRISGGGRCNVTHACHDLDDLLACYPRGGPRLEAILGRFMPQDTIDWFHRRGVKLKTEADGRMFPTTNNSQTIIDCLLRQSDKLGVVVQTKSRVDKVTKWEGQFDLKTRDSNYRCKKLLLATGGNSTATKWLQELGHDLVPDIPSLFTFCCNDKVFEGLQGLSVEPVELSLKTKPEYQAEGPFLITHWGLSGPSVLKLSAFAARTLYDSNYEARLVCNFLPQLSAEEIESELARQAEGKQIQTVSPFPSIPKRLWKRLVGRAGVKPGKAWGKLTSAQMIRLVETLSGMETMIKGKGVFKEEFVTSGGLPLHEIDVYTMESRRVSNLFVAGELLNVDGITGGFNFQNAWAGGYVAGEGMS